jgi:SPP1 gp7 family putative phage head morphogenesis protein
VEVRLEPLDFERALEFFRDKVVLAPDEFRALWEEYRSLAFTVSGIAALDVLHDIYRELLRAIEEGLTARDFAESFGEILERRGWEGLAPHRVDNVFRTNVQTAYMVGHYRRMTDPDVVRRRPYWMYDAVNDRRTRPSHAAMDGKVYPADHPFWDVWYPPNGYRCRCGVRTLSAGEVERKRLKVETEMPEVMPDPGFAHNPARVKWEPDLSKYPPALRRAYEVRVTGGRSGVTDG